MILITFASVRFTGVLFVQDDVTNDDDVVGFLFGYQVPLELDRFPASLEQVGW